MNTAITIRDYVPSDGTTCHRLRRDAFLGVFSEILPDAAVRAGADSYDVSEFAERIGTMETIVATMEKIIVGFCTIRIDSPERAEILYLYIDPQHRGVGIGSSLIRHAEKRVSDSYPGLASLYLDTAVPEYNRGFWEAMGYRYIDPSTCDYPNAKIPAIRLEKKTV
jgi:ribosomal protein S18 acetylase RimI-like enzyme